MAVVTSAQKILFGILDGKRTLLRLGREWNDNIRTDLKKIG
jgi:hypothetical protein